MRKVYRIAVLACLSFHYVISAISYVHILYIYCKFMQKLLAYYCELDRNMNGRTDKRMNYESAKSPESKEKV